MNELINGNAIKMTSIEIAELVGKRHDNVKRTIETLAKNGVIRLPQIEVSERINNLGFNVQYEHYVFEGEQGKRDSIVVVAQLSPEFTARLVDRWRELEEAAVNIPKTLPEALRLAADLAEQKMQLENQLAIAAPKVEFADRVGGASGILIGNFAKVVGIGPNKLFAWMRDHKILIASGSRRNVPMQEYMERGYFTVKETAVSGFTQYELGSVRDITRLRGRYAWSKDGTDSWFITDLEDESHPDRYSAQYRAESQPDGIIGIGTWRDFIVCFGSSTIEYFSLTGATTVGAALYVAQPSLMVQKGIAGTYCKTPFADSYAFISNPATGAPSVYIIGSGQVSPIASASIEKILRSYTADELADGVMESLRFDAHELLIIHLPRHVLVYDASSSANGPQWCVLKTGLYDDVYRAIDFIYEGNQITCGDKLESMTGKLQFDISSQYDKQQEHLLFTPLFKADNARVFDLEVESSTGVAQYADRLFLSATTDGINYGREQMIEQNEPFVYDKRVLWKRVGRIRKNVGFKLRVITKSPVTLSGCQIRIE